ncbi:hypothetical protein HF086_009997 [Spodoptera exigua]|uniref:ODAD1 central coiled coil region domain-containing protein n=1 Tax=Spodoptera exigua TaxID=7107 RepID=A0A922MQZ6_SPOEX|nr:hypothetical protein HF086_009997 [Spodoptera exigua]
MAALIAPTDDMEMEKIAEDELSKLQRQFRVMEIDRATVLSSVQPTLRMQKNIINTLNADLEKIMLELKFTKSTSNLMEGAKNREKLITLLKEHEKYSSEVKDHRENIKELDFLLKQVQKEIKSLRSKVTGSEIAYSNVLTGQTLISQLENRLDTAMKKFNTVNSENYSMRLEIDRLLRDRQFFNTHWKNQLKRLMDGKAMIIELLEQAISTYDQREEWCSKLDALKEKAATDYRKHCLEVRELQRQLDHSMKLEEFLRTKGTVRLTAADAKAEAKKLEQQEEEMRIYNNYVNILDALKEFAGEDDVDKLIQEFTRREEENYALFNYINEVCTELKNLSDNVKMLRANIGKPFCFFYCVHVCFYLMICAEKKTMGLTYLLLGKAFDINVTNARLYIKSLEKKVLEIIDIIRIDELIQRQTESKERTPPSTRRRRGRAAPPTRTRDSVAAQA